jgi:predicted NBD/HSP70 family sugar kinase
LELAKGGNKEVYKRLNRGLLLKLLATGQCNSRIELSRTMELSKMAISNIVSGLIEQDVIIEGKTKQNDELGRNPIGLHISPNAPKIIGILIFRDRCEAILCDMALEIYKRTSLTMESTDNEKLIQMLYELVDTMIADCPKIIGIGVASIGPIDTVQGMILKPNFFFGIENVPIVEKLTNKYHVPVFLENDNQCGVLAEKLYGAGKEYSDILFLGMAQGIGCGIITNNQLYSNRNKLVPEFGHISIDNNGNECICGNRGCIETYIGTPVLLEKLREATGKYYSFKNFCKMDANSIVSEIFKNAINALTTALVSTINLLNSELIILGYDGVYLSDNLIKILEDKVNERKFTKETAHVSIKRPFFMLDAQLMGAACIINKLIFSGELLF